MQENHITLGAAVEALHSRLDQLAVQAASKHNELACPISAGALTPIVLPSVLDYVGQCFSLSPLEQGVLLLCVAMEFDDQIPQLCDRAQGSRGMAYPTLDLAFEVFGQWHWETLSSEGALRYWQLLELKLGENIPLRWCPIRISDRMLNFLAGSYQLDCELATLFYPIRLDDAGELPELSPSQMAVVAEICAALSALEPGHPWPIIQLLGENAASKQQIALAVADKCSRLLYGLRSDSIPSSNAEFQTFLRLWDREERLLQLALYLDTQAASTSGITERFVSQCRGLLFLDSGEVSVSEHRTTLTFTAGKPEPDEQYLAWTQALGEALAEAPRRLASQFSLSFGEIKQIAVATASQTDANRFPALWQACLQRSAPRLEQLAQRLVVKANWDQLVLPEEATEQLWQMVHQVRLRSRVYDEWGFRARLNRGLGTAAMVLPGQAVPARPWQRR